MRRWLVFSRNRLSKAVFLAVPFLFGGGCALFESSEPEEPPSTLMLSMNASAAVNPNVFIDNSLTLEVDAPADPPADPERPANPAGAPGADGGLQPLAAPIELKPGQKILACKARPATPPEPEEPVTAAIDPPVETFEPEATPVAFKIIQLKENSLFLQADFDSLFNDMETVLGTTYLAHDDYVLIPNEFKYIEPFEVEEDTRYVAVIAAYNDYVNKQWKEIVKIKAKGMNYAISLYFDDQKVAMRKQEL